MARLAAVCLLAAAPLAWVAVWAQVVVPPAFPACLAMSIMIFVLVAGRRRMNMLASRRPGRSGRFGRYGWDDELTGLLGRRAFLDEASRVVAQAAPGPGPASTGPRTPGAGTGTAGGACRAGAGAGGSRGAAFLLVDLDRFRDVNDTLGHDAGDRLLRGVGQRLRTVLRNGDVLGHLGGDEFAVVIANADADGAQRAAQRLRAALRAPHRLADMPVPATASVGIALAPTHGRTVDDLLVRAEEAMYEAKRECSGQRVFDSGCRRSSRDRLRLRAELPSVLEDGQLGLRYQPKVDLRTGRVTGVEALVRWCHPVDGLRSPDVFLPEMERSGLMRPLTERVLDLALGDHVRWRAAGALLPVSVNVPASVIVDEAFVGVVRDALARHGLPPTALTVEVTEDGVMTARDRAQRVLAGLRSAGVRVSLDDYGTGFCSLAYLRELPADELKLDRSLLGDIEHSASAAEIVRSTVGLAHALDLTIVAEGVESAGSWAVLAGWGCDDAQGYFVSPPLEGGHVLEWLYEWWQRLQGLSDMPYISGIPGTSDCLAGVGNVAESALAAFTPGAGSAGHGGVSPGSGYHGPPARPGQHPPLWLVGFRASQRADVGGCRPGGARGRPSREFSSP